MRNQKRVLATGIWVFCLLLASGCAAEQQRKAVNAGYQSLEHKQYDQALSQADDYLRANPTGPGSADMLYLRGRALEGKASGDSAESQGNWQQARAAYVLALGQGPKQPLEWHVRASLANVAYFQDDYATALTQWSQSFDPADQESKPWILYRLGICQQRLGRFDQADRSFAAVQQQFPNSMPAQRAREHAGARGFYVQVGTFGSAAGADKAVNTLKTQGVTPGRVTNASGQQVVRVGPMQSFDQAKAMRGRVAGAFPDALIVP